MIAASASNIVEDMIPRKEDKTHRTMNPVNLPQKFLARVNEACDARLHASADDQEYHPQAKAKPNILTLILEKCPSVGRTLQSQIIRFEPRPHREKHLRCKENAASVYQTDWTASETQRRQVT